VKNFSIELSALSPLAIRADHAPGGAETAKLITGTTLAGSLAAVHRLLRGEEKEEFEALFLSGQVHYPNLYPASFSYEKMQDFHLPVYPVPKTAQSCKRYKGFLFPKDDDEERHGVRDSLLDWAMFKLSNANDNKEGDITPLKALLEYKTCPHDMSDGLGPYKRCDATMNHFEGYYRRQRREPYNMIATQDASTRLQTHTGINREFGIVEEGVLYNRRVFVEGTRFWGMIRLPDDEQLANTFETFIREASKEKLVRIGTGRTRGLGKVDLSLEAIEEEQDRFSSFKNRLSVFDTALKMQAEKYGIHDLKPFYFALTLHSPVILCDDLLSYRSSIPLKIVVGFFTNAEHRRT
jgi:CRISPR-associated protein Csx10